jgi:uncharacterized membrane protein YkgB
MDMKITFSAVDAAIVAWMRAHGLRFLRYSMAIIFIWFGALKVFDASPADYLVTQTVFWFDPVWFIPFLGVWEMAIGLCFLHPKLLRIGIFLLVPQMAGTFLPFFFLPHITLQNGSILTPTMEGQYIIKNIVLISAAIVIGSHARNASQKEEGDSVLKRKSSRKKR